MKRFVPLLFLLAIACGKEASIVPIVSVPPTSSPTPSPTAVVTYEPFTTPAPTEQPLITPTPVPTAAPTASATSTPGSGSFPTHTPTPTGQPPDAYMRGKPGGEIKGLIVYCTWSGYKSCPTDPNKNADPSDSISVKKGEFLGVLFTHSGKPNPIGARYRTDPSWSSKSTAIPIKDGNPAVIQANFPSGTVWVDVFSYWGKDEVDYTFKLSVS
jgi:hypothetical protein